MKILFKVLCLASFVMALACGRQDEEVGTLSRTVTIPPRQSAFAVPHKSWSLHPYIKQTGQLDLGKCLEYTPYDLNSTTPAVITSHYWPQVFRCGPSPKQFELFFTNFNGTAWQGEQGFVQIRFANFCLETQHNAKTYNPNAFEFAEWRTCQSLNNTSSLALQRQIFWIGPRNNTDNINIVSKYAFLSGATDPQNMCVRIRQDDQVGIGPCTNGFDWQVTGN